MPHPRSVLVWLVADAEITTDRSTKSKCLWHTQPQIGIYITLPHKAQNSHKKRNGPSVRARSLGEHEGNSVFWSWQNGSPQHLWFTAHHLPQDQASHRSRLERQWVFHSPMPNWGAMDSSSFWRTESEFSLNVSPLIGQIPSSRCPPLRSK